MAFEIHLERGKIREFARATGSTNAAYLGDDPVIQPTFLTTATNFWATPQDTSEMAALDFDPRRVLHGEEEYEFFGSPPRAGQSLSAVARLGERWEKAGKRGGVMRFAKIVIEFRDSASGNLVAEQRTTIIETAKPPTQEA